MSGVAINRPMVAERVINKRVPTFTADVNEGKFFADVFDDEGEVAGRKMIRFVRAVVVVTTAYNDKVAFCKSNRGRTYRDSRTPKKNISGDECLSELHRLLDDKWNAQQAFQQLQV